jgi:hypothetical protein
MSPGKKELTPNVYLPQQPLHAKTKQLIRKVFPGAKKCLHALDAFNVFKLCLSIYHDDDDDDDDVHEGLGMFPVP